MRDLLPEFLADVARDEALAAAENAIRDASPTKPGGFLTARFWGKARAVERKEDEVSTPTDDERGGDALLTKFLDEASALNHAIDQWRADLGDLRLTHGKACQAASTKALAEVTKQCEDKTKSASTTAARIKTKIDHLARGGTTFETLVHRDCANASSDANAQQRAHQKRVVQTVSLGVRKRFDAVVDDFGNLRVAHRKVREETLRTRHFLKHGNIPDPELLSRATEAEGTGAAERLMDQMVVLAESRTGKKQVTFAIDNYKPKPLELETRVATSNGHRADDGQQQLSVSKKSEPSSSTSLDLARQKKDLALELETGMVQLHTVFLDMAVMIEHQGEGIDSVETHVAQASSLAQRSNVILRSAREYQKQRTRRMRYVCVMVFVVVLIAVSVVISGFRDAM